MLKAGVYHDLKPKEALVLDTGTFTFIGLEMKGLGKGIWLDSRRAKKIALLHCKFKGMGKGTGLLASGETEVSQCLFEKLERGICIIQKKKKKQDTHFNMLTIRTNTFTNNLSSIYLDGGFHNLDLRCNAFAQNEAIPTGEERTGLFIGDNASLFQNRIGGNGDFGNPPPNGNFFPRNGAGLNATAVQGYVRIKNESSNIVRYWAYGNEMVLNVVPNQNSGLPNSIIFPLLPENTFIVNDDNIEAHCAANNNCNQSSLEACSTEVLSSVTCTGGVKWVKACSGGPTENVGWPVAGKAVDPGANTPTSTPEAFGKKETQLGQSIPNPGKDKIVIPLFLAENSQGATLQIVEMATGKTIAWFPDLKSGEMRLEMNVSHYAAGVYAYKLLPAKGKVPKARNFVIIR